MLSQQMKSTPSFQIEADDVHSSTDRLHPFATPSIAVVANYNIQRNSIICHRSPTRPPTNNNASTLPNYGYVESLCLPLQRSTIDPLLPDYEILGPQLPPATWICSYFGNFSQSAACIAVGFGECSSTFLDKLWYLYSYIYN